MDMNKDTLRNIPQVEKLLQDETIACFRDILGHGTVVKIIRGVVDDFRRSIAGGENPGLDRLTDQIVQACRRVSQERLQRVINCSGVIIHTNLGRSPLGADIFKKMGETLSGYCNLEFHIPTQRRDKRGGFAESLLCGLTGAEDALIVNNNASSVFLILNEFSRGKEVIVSRGELIQIGGGFRIPDIMHQSGAHLVEVGTTNITELDDFRHAVTERTSMIFSAHQSNYRIQGFTDAPSLKELATLKSDSVIFTRDLGSGNLVSHDGLPQPFEPTISYELKQGADLICFSGDKLLGGCQAGIIIGRKDLIEKLKKNPLMRMLRVDKITYFILQETLLEYEKGTQDGIPLWNIIHQNEKTLSARASSILRKVKNSHKSEYCRKTGTRATFGGGALPTMEIVSMGISIDVPVMKPDDVAAFFLEGKVPILGTVTDGRFMLDVMTVFDRDTDLIAGRIDDLLSRKVES